MRAVQHVSSMIYHIHRLLHLRTAHLLKLICSLVHSRSAGEPGKPGKGVEGPPGPKGPQGPPGKDDI